MSRCLCTAVLLVAVLAAPSRAGDYTGALCINEVSALGVGRDWVELYNRSAETIDCLSLVLSDNLDGSGNQWPLCIGNLRSGERRIVTCPNLLNGNGEELAIFTRDGMLVDSVTYGRQTFNLTFGRFPDGGSRWCFQYPTEREPNGLVPEDSPPVIIGAPHHWPLRPGAGEPAFVSAAVVAAHGLATVELVYFTGAHEPPEGAAGCSAACNDAGTDQDDVAGDGRFTGRLPVFTADTIVRYRVHAVDTYGNEAFAPSPTEFYGIHVGYIPPPIRINEIMASNHTTGRYTHQGDRYLSDWIELVHAGDPGSPPIDISGWFLSDRRTTAVPFPILGESDTVMAPGGHLLVWAKRGFPEDATLAVGVNFSLSRNGEEVTLFAENGFSVVDAVTFPPLPSDETYARDPEGTGDFIHCAEPTPEGGEVAPPKRVEIVSYEPRLPDLGQAVTVTVSIHDELDVDRAEITYWLLEEGRVPLRDDGTSGDQEAGDGIYTGRLGPFDTSGTVYFAAEVTTRDGTELRDPERPMIWYQFPLSWRPTETAIITEVFPAAHLCCCGCLAFQSLTGPLEPRNFVEVQNIDDTALNPADLWLTDDPLDLYKVPLAAEGDETVLLPGERTVVWFFGGDEQKILDPAGGTLFLVGGRRILDTVTYGEARAGQSYGYLPQGAWSSLPSPSPGEPNGAPFFLRADANADLRLDIADPVFMLTALFASAEIGCSDAADADDSGDLDIADPISVLSYLFAAGPCPLPPFPNLGTDATVDALDCQHYLGAAR